ncbi:glycosyltransferase [Novosphingobium umbonatum]|uniref:Glycosyltransferase n=1 Tax=Novosphingobium umbonatum TaxID=1908524 RepID=A0A3S2UV74_9SPHN|nr:glycosyltransferase [Novosphingobium umbonatum]RVU07913.1 glycosyltransferase [Novosphingobium umbonatum]
MTSPASPRISVAMSVYNGERFLAPAIESILAQTLGDFELLLLDDGSSDGSADIIRSYAAQDARIRPILRENRGLIASLNEMLAEARAPVIARMDADDIALPERFARQIAFLDAHPDHGVVGAQTIDIDQNGQPWPHATATLPTSHEALLDAIAQGQPLICHPVAMMRRKVVLGVGGYHAAFHHCEDLDLWLRLASVTRLCSLPEPLIRYRHYDQQVSTRHATIQQTGAAVARLAYAERAAGRSDPTQALAKLPPLDDMDALFGRDGVTKALRAQIAQSLRYSPAAMRDHGYDLLLRHLAEGGSHAGMRRTVARLVKFGLPLRALRLALALLCHRPVT